MEYSREWGIRNRAKVVLRSKKWQKTNRKKINIAKRIWYKKNAENVLLRTREKRSLKNLFGTMVVSQSIKEYAAFIRLAKLAFLSKISFDDFNKIKKRITKGHTYEAYRRIY